MTLDRGDERERLAAIADDSLYAVGANGASVRYCSRLFRRYWRGGHCLELGPAEGVMTAALADAFDTLEAVDGSERYAAGIRERFPQARVHVALFEDFEPDRSFDAIIIGHVLEHVEDPVALMARARGWLAPGGSVFLAVPNARSLHRQAAVLMGLLPDEHAFSGQDEHNGHRRVYDGESLRADVRAAGLRVDVFGGYWLKPLSNAQIEADWDEAMLEAFMALGERYPDIAGEIYVIAGS